MTRVDLVDQNHNNLNKASYRSLQTATVQAATDNIYLVSQPNLTNHAIIIKHRAEADIFCQPSSFAPIDYPNCSTLTTGDKEMQSPHTNGHDAFSLDGQGSETVNLFKIIAISLISTILQMHIKKAVPRYGMVCPSFFTNDIQANNTVHYSLYAKDSPLESHNPMYCNNRSISRILSKSVPPPRTAASLKRYLCRTEGFEKPDNCDLYLSLSERAPLDDSVHLLLRENPGPGSGENEPMVLLVNVPAAGKRSLAETPVPEQVAEEVLQYGVHLPADEIYTNNFSSVYYRLYDQDGELVSKTSFDETDTYLGRIETFSVPPPRTVVSLKCRLRRVEDTSNDRAIEIFEDEDSKTTLNDGDTVTLDADVYQGINEDKPMAVVMKAEKAVNTPQLATPTRGLRATVSCSA